jgi:hypothetical protein
MQLRNDNRGQLIQDVIEKSVLFFKVAKLGFSLAELFDLSATPDMTAHIVATLLIMQHGNYSRYVPRQPIHVIF